MNTEILAPLGDVLNTEKLIDAGANALYAGLKNYSARPSFADLSMEELEQALSVCHSRKVKLYVAINACISHVNEAEVKELIKRLDAMGMDAVILSDFGLIYYACQNVTKMEIHASTLLGVFNSRTISVLQRWGVRRIVLSTNSYLDEISRMIDAFPELDYEFVASGGICFNDNRQCELPHVYADHVYDVYCRKEYVYMCNGECEKARTIAGKHIESHEIAKLYLELGLKSFKIEGRTENPEKIINVIRKLKTALDNIVFCQSSNTHYINRMRNERK